MKIELLNLKFQNIRNYDDLYISFTDDDAPFNVTLIQMPNGTGKTTASTLIRYLFSGSELSSESIMDFKPKNSNETEGLAAITINVDNEPYTVELNLNYATGTYSYHTTSTSKYGGRVSGHKLPEKAKFNFDLTKLFVFDGELVGDLINRDQSVAESIMDMLYGLDKITELSIQAKENGTKIFNNSNLTITTNQGVKQQRTILKSLESTLEHLKDAQNEANEQLNTLNKEYERIDSELYALTDENTKIRLDELKDQIDSTKNTIKEKTDILFKNTTPVPILSKPLFDSMKKLRNEMDILKLPKSTASDFFDELITQDYCICGNHMTEEMRTRIVENSKKYLSEDMQSVMNSIKIAIKNNTSIDDFDYDGLKNEIENYTVQLTKLETEKKIQEDKNNGSNTQTILRLSSELSNVKQDLEYYKEILESLTDPDFEDADEKTNIPKCEEQITQLKSKLIKADMALKRREQAYLLSELYSKIHDNTLSKLKKIIKTSTNEKLNKVLNGDNISIKSIEKAIILDGQTSASEAQKLSVGYTYIMSLFENSLYDMPFIIDSPCGSLDLKNRRQIADLIPKIFNQSIMFITSSERQDFAEHLLKLPDVKTYTIFKNPENENKIEISEDKLFFNQYQDSEEE